MDLTRANREKRKVEREERERERESHFIDRTVGSGLTVHESTFTFLRSTANEHTASHTDTDAERERERERIHTPHGPIHVRTQQVRNMPGDTRGNCHNFFQVNSATESPQKPNFTQRQVAPGVCTRILGAKLELTNNIPGI